MSLFWMVILFMIFQPSYQKKYLCNPKPECECSMKPASLARIVGGEEAGQRTWGWVVSFSISADQGQILCGGSIKINLFILQSNQTIFNQIKQNISFVNKNQSILFNQLSTINNQRFYLTQNLDFLQNKFLIEQQQILNILNKINHIKHMINLNNQKFQRLTLEKQTIIPFLLKKQYLILLITKNINFNENILIKYRSTYE